MVSLNTVLVCTRYLGLRFHDMTALSVYELALTPLISVLAT